MSPLDVVCRVSLLRSTASKPYLPRIGHSSAYSSILEMDPDLMLAQTKRKNLAIEKYASSCSNTMILERTDSHLLTAGGYPLAKLVVHVGPIQTDYGLVEALPRWVQGAAL